MNNYMPQPLAVPKNIIITNDGRKYKKANLAQTTGAVAIATGCGWATLYGAGNLFNFMFAKKYMKRDPKDSAACIAAIESALEKSGLKTKNLKIIDAGDAKNKKSLETLFSLKSLEEKYSKSKNFLTKLFLKRRIKKCKEIISSVSNGTDAFYAPNNNWIVLNKKKRAISVFHEMGHAMNNHFSCVGKALQKIRHKNKYILGILVATALFKRKKVEGEKTEGWFDKTTTFVKNNVGKLAFISFLPMLIEEAMASIKGQKLAKTLLSADKIKNITKHNSLGWLSYLAGAVIYTLSIVVASNARDELVPPQKISSASN